MYGAKLSVEMKMVESVSWCLEYGWALGVQMQCMMWSVKMVVVESVSWCWKCG